MKAIHPHMIRVLSVLIAVVLCAGQFGCKDDAHAPHAGHEEHGEHNEHRGHDVHDEPSVDVVRLTGEQLKEAGVVIAPLGGGTISRQLTLPGEIAFNANTMAHITPRVPGIAVEVHAHLGDEVKPGRLLAVMESSELGQAKIDYLTSVQTLDQARADLERQRTISTNTDTLLALLKGRPTLEELQDKASGLVVGENKGRLITTYAKMTTSRANNKREQSLRQQGLSTQSDLLAAEEAFNSARAEYFAALEDISFRYQVRLTQAQQAYRVAETAMNNAERRLHLLGLSDDKVKSIQSEPDTAISRYELQAPIAGRIVAKHISVGEKTSGEQLVFTIADLSTVWLNISVYAKYLSDIHEGQNVTVTAGERTAAGRISYIGSTLSESTRTVIARVVLENKDVSWRPGEFMTVHIEISKDQVKRAVPVGAVQTFEGKSVIFVQDEDGIEPRPVRLGRRSEQMVELLAGPEVGAPVVMKNSFLMKSELGKSAAGHEH